ncbi:hypothetical protein P43SY_004694 [Pythium insidiosum]|uniref:Transmembrane protein n=1 Tax=Pythium insidiosum TaxID=114742 RepID=A0AAD5M0M9_PYTIN|nr:hypothetical protein P43SY_004694 [Pythium insidiosum]
MCLAHLSPPRVLRVLSTPLLLLLSVVSATAFLETMAPSTTNDSVTIHVLERYHPSFATQYQLHEYKPALSQGFHIVLSFQASSTGRECFRVNTAASDSHVWVPDDSWRVASLRHQAAIETFCVELIEPSSNHSTPSPGTMTYVEILSGPMKTPSSSAIGVENEAAGRSAFRTTHSVRFVFRPLSYRVWQQLPILTLVKSMWVTAGTEDELPAGCPDREGKPIKNAIRPRGNVKDDRTGGPKLGLCVMSDTLSTRSFLANDSTELYMTDMEAVPLDRRLDDDANAMRVPLQLNTTHNFFICYQLARLTVAPGQRLLGSEAFIQELVINETTSAREERIQILPPHPVADLLAFAVPERLAHTPEIAPSLATHLELDVLVAWFCEQGSKPVEIQVFRDDSKHHVRVAERLRTYCSEVP